MTLNDILKYVNYICVKENSGSTLKPDQYNNILSASNINMFNRKVQEAQVISNQAQRPFNQALYEHVALREFHTSQNITWTLGQFNLTTLTDAYAYFLSMVCFYKGTFRRIDILTDNELTERRTNLAGKRLEEYPACVILGNTMKIYPSEIYAGEFTFMKIPTTPVFDYYYDQYQNLVYLTQGSSHYLTSGETGSIGQTGSLVISATKELAWNQLWHVEFCNEILQKVGINLKDEQIRQYVREVEGKQV